MTLLLSFTFMLEIYGGLEVLLTASAVNLGARLLVTRSSVVYLVLLVMGFLYVPGAAERNKNAGQI